MALTVGCGQKVYWWLNPLELTANHFTSTTCAVAVSFRVERFIPMSVLPARRLQYDHTTTPPLKLIYSKTDHRVLTKRAIWSQVHNHTCQKRFLKKIFLNIMDVQLFTFLPKNRWEDRYHSHVFCIECSPGASRRLDYLSIKTGSMTLTLNKWKWIKKTITNDWTELNDS